jgi:quercetin dioxygenase-like cupin family protein
MALSHLPSGQKMSVRPLGEALARTRSSALLKSAQLEVIRVVIPAGRTLHEHHFRGELTLLCIEGHIQFHTPAGVHDLAPGDFIHLQRDAPHSLSAEVDSSALLTLCVCT